MMGRGEWMLVPELRNDYLVPVTRWVRMSQETRETHVLWALSEGERVQGVSRIVEDPSTHFRVPHMGGTRK